MVTRRWPLVLLRVSALNTCEFFDSVQGLFTCANAGLPLLGLSGDCREECSGSLGDLGFRSSPAEGLCVRYQKTGAVPIVGTVFLQSSVYDFTCLGQYEVLSAVETLRFTVAATLNVPLSEVSAVYALGEDKQTDWSSETAHSALSWETTGTRRLADTCSPACLMGACVDGSCECFPGYTGRYCQLEIPGSTSCRCDDNVGCWSRANLGCCRTDASLSTSWCGCPGTTGGLMDQVGAIWTKNFWRTCSVTFWCQDESGTTAAKDATYSDVTTLDECKQKCIDHLICAYFEFNKKFALCKISHSPKVSSEFLDGTVESGNFLCEPRLDPCSVVDGNFFGSYCGSHGKCAALLTSDSSDLGEASCLCKDGYSGDFCETAPPGDPCEVEPLCPGQATCEMRVVAVPTDYGTSVAEWARANRLCGCSVGWTGSGCDQKQTLTVRMGVAVEMSNGFSPGFMVYGVAYRIVSMINEDTHLIDMTSTSETACILTFLILTTNEAPAEDAEQAFAVALSQNRTLGDVVADARISFVNFLTEVPAHTKYATKLLSYHVAVTVTVATRRLSLSDMQLFLAQAISDWRVGVVSLFQASSITGKLVQSGADTLVSGASLDEEDFLRKTTTTTPAPDDLASDDASSVVGIVLGTVATVVGAGVAVYVRKFIRSRKQRLRQVQQANSEPPSEDDLPQTPVRNTARELKKAEISSPVVEEELPASLTLKGILGRAKIDEKSLRQQLSAWRDRNASGRAKRQLMAAWHPDRAKGEAQKALATRTFQWLSELK